MTFEGWKGTAGHVLVTLVASVLSIWVGWIVAIAFLSREITQAEYRYFDKYGETRYVCPWYCGLLPESWTLKAMLDWILPVVTVIIVALITS